MALLRSSTTPSPGRTLRRAARRRAAALAGVAALLGATACGFNVQTNQPYTPADGVNIDVGPAAELKVRNLKILSRTPGQGILSATMTSSEQDSLVAVTGNAIKANNSAGSALDVRLPNPVPLGPGELVVLTDRPLITMTSADLLAGLEARVVMQFSQAGQVELVAPVIDANQPEFITISPAPLASPSPAAE